MTEDDEPTPPPEPPTQQAPPTDSVPEPMDTSPFTEPELEQFFGSEDYVPPGDGEPRHRDR